MNVGGKHYRTIWPENNVIKIIDQRRLPFEFVIEEINTVDQMASAIKYMHVRGAGLIGAAAGYGMYLAAIEDSIEESAKKLISTRPTAVNLSMAVERQLKNIIMGKSEEEKIQIALKTANEIADEDVEFCRKIGEHGLKLVEEISRKKKGSVVNILTHCNAGWLAFVDFGSATSPIYAAFDKGIKVHVWVDETRPRNQGARLTAWELGEHGVHHTIIADNTGGHLMQKGMVDMVIVGSDRTTYTGDVANKIGTYLKALAAKDNNIPFYVALPSTTIDWKTRSGKEIIIEERDDREVKYIEGMHEGSMKEMVIMPENSPASNYAFDVTPSRLVTGLITERGVSEANEKSILELFPEQKEGYIKFKCNWKKAEPPDYIKIEKLNYWRQKLYSLGLIGAYEDGTGFGNISIRDGNSFIISGSTTGKFAKLNQEHYTTVTDFDLEKNTLDCRGQIIASSESLTHAVIYKQDNKINSVIHIHSKELWEKLLNRIPTTSKKAAYGTPEMAREVIRLFKETDVREKKVFAMSGHEEGIVAFGKDVEEAGENILKLSNKALLLSTKVI